MRWTVKLNSQRGESDSGGLVLFIIFIYLIYQAFTGTSSPSYDYDDESYYEENVVERYDALYNYWDEISEYLDGNYEVEACSDNSGNCYYLEADIVEGEIETLYFPNGGYVYIYGAKIDRDGDASGYDDGDYEDYWNFEIDENDIDDALELWADNNEYILE